jgi:uncharacterized protein
MSENNLPNAASAPSPSDLLRNSKTIAVVGLSSNPMRTSFGVSHYMQEQGYRIIPVNPQESEVLGEKSYASLTEISEPVDIVNVFRRSEFVPGVVDAAIQIGAKAVWMQEGVEHEAAAEKARAAGLVVVQNRCILKAHRGLGLRSS